MNEAATSFVLYIPPDGNIVEQILSIPTILNPSCEGYFPRDSRSFLRTTQLEYTGQCMHTLRNIDALKCSFVRIISLVFRPQSWMMIRL